MPYCVHWWHICEESLSSANVWGCSFSSNMLFSWLHSHSIGKTSMRILTHSNNSARHLESVFINSGKVSSMRSSETHWNSKSLCRTERNVCSHLTWTLMNSCWEKILNHNYESLRLMNLFHLIFPIHNSSFNVWVLKNYSAEISSGWEINCIGVSNFNFNSKRLSSSLDDSKILREYFIRNKNRFPLFPMNAIAHSHCLSWRSRFIEQRSVWNGKSCYFCNHCLEI